MKLIYLGEEIDSSVEQEIFYDEAKHPFGFDVILTYKDGETKPEHKVNTHHNCTEVHHLYNDLGIINGDKRIALESDLHGTGGTRDINRLISVDITIAKVMADHH